MSTRHLLSPSPARSCHRRARQYRMQSFRFEVRTHYSRSMRAPNVAEATVELRWGGGFQGLFMHYFSPFPLCLPLSRAATAAPRAPWHCQATPREEMERRRAGKKEGGREISKRAGQGGATFYDLSTSYVGILSTEQ